MICQHLAKHVIKVHLNALQSDDAVEGELHGTGHTQAFLSLHYYARVESIIPSSEFVALSVMSI